MPRSRRSAVSAVLHERGSRPTIVRFLRTGDEAGVDDAIASSTGHLPLDIALMRVVGAEIIEGPARVRWLREALHLYETAGPSLTAARVRPPPSEGGGLLPPPRRADGRLPGALPR